MVFPGILTSLTIKKLYCVSIPIHNKLLDIKHVCALADYEEKKVLVM